MNGFFVPGADIPREVPPAAYARLDQVEPGDLEADAVLFVFSAVAAEWIDQHPSPALNGMFGRRAAPAWDAYWTAMFGGDADAYREEGFEPFEDMPLFLFEILVRRDQREFDEYVAAATDERRWVRIEEDPTSDVQAAVYANLHQAAPPVAPVSLLPVPEGRADALSMVFDMDSWPEASSDGLAEVLTTDREPVTLAVFDIGQGLASALLDGGELPWLYYDLGAGITRNKHTTPLPLKFCWTRDPTVLLSHWDMDHWAGATHDSDALTRTWIAPKQTISPGHTAFATSILEAGGRLLIWPASQGPLRIGTGHPNQSLIVDRCTGSDRNGSGIAMRVDWRQDDSELLHWALTGDAGYHQLPFGFDGEVVASVVPHHGGKAGVSKIPGRREPEYARLLFSFGPGNDFGSKKRPRRHPREDTVQGHETAGWDPGTWRGDPDPGFSVGGDDVLATAEHLCAHLGGCVAGWTGPPLPGPRPCGGTDCTTEISQS